MDTNVSKYVSRYIWKLVAIAGDSSSDLTKIQFKKIYSSEKPHSILGISEIPPPNNLRRSFLNQISDSLTPLTSHLSPLTLRFLKNGALLDLSSRYTFKENVGLTFTTYDSRDSGVYQCVAFNSKHWKQKMTFVMITGE